AGNEAAGNPQAQIAAILAAIAAVALAMLLLICEMAYVTGMAGAAWKHGTASLRDGWEAFERRGSEILVAIVLLFAIGLVAALLAPVTLLLSGAAYAALTIYTLAAVIIGERSALAGIAESFALAWENLWPTLAVVALVVAIAAAGGWLGGWLGGLAGRASPLLAGLVAAVAQQIVVAYATLVVVGEYLKLRNLHEAPGGSQ
ncbi:MAG TPA: hypothetical protein VMH02_06690, partial [Verrucomicrobiae bacterium]|nr:hypothetical protein [Verrucomicrobiae bacterium]